jgi:uncharacterized protein
VAALVTPSTVLPSIRESFSFQTADGFKLIGEKALPEGEVTASILCLHPNPSGGGMMDSHIYKKCANRLPFMAGLEIIRFNTRGTESPQGKSEGEFTNGRLEKYDVEAALEFAFNQSEVEKLYVMGWSFGTDLALQYARDLRIKELILLSPPLKTTTDDDLAFWKSDGRKITALIPEFDDYLTPPQAKERFGNIPNINQIDVAGAKHLWVGEPAVYRVLSEIVKIVAPEKLPLPLEI